MNQLQAISIPIPSLWFPFSVRVSCNLNQSYATILTSSPLRLTNQQNPPLWAWNPELLSPGEPLLCVRIQHMQVKDILCTNLNPPHSPGSIQSTFFPSSTAFLFFNVGNKNLNFNKTKILWFLMFSMQYLSHTTVPLIPLKASFVPCLLIHNGEELEKGQSK